MTGQTEEGLPVDGAVRVTIKPLSDYFASGSQKAADEVFELQKALARELPGELEARTAPGEKGIVTDLIITLGSSGAIAAMVEVFKAWLGKRPENREIDLEFEIDESEKGKRSGTLHLEATNVETAVLDNITKGALRPGS